MKQRRSLKGTTRWYRIVDGEVERCSIHPHETLDPSWQRGLGPIDNVFANYLTKQRFAGRPKTPQQLERMRQAKLGVPKSEEHRRNMSAAHFKRAEETREIMRELGIKWSEASLIRKQRNK
jgi:hypothetical protein